ncbi:MAG: DUF3526 domain-containing protein [Pseudomonadota bacterium]
MKQITAIAAAEWHYWARSKLALTVALVALLLIVLAALTSAERTNTLAHERNSLQSDALEIFQAQPDRHPHRMVHYGHYAFKPPPPLSVVDPGVDAYSGNVIFLEGHRQNTAMFAERENGAVPNLLGSLSPAFVLQVLAPICLILIGYGALTREREGQTALQLFSQGVSPAQLLAGKFLALFSVALLMLIPLAAAALSAMHHGEAVSIVTSLITGYGAYLTVWILFVIFASAVSRNSAASLMLLLGAWTLVALILPSYATNSGRLATESTGKIESDFALLAELRTLGDGHNSADPAFASFRAKLLETHGVERVEDLPINFRGAVATKAEADLTAVLRRYAEQRFESESRQAAAAGVYGWLSPVIAMRELSMAIAGTDLLSHHRFLREAEALRFDFVQGLNAVHTNQLSYQDDMNRSNDPEAERRTRANAENWQVLEDYRFGAATSKARLANGAGGASILLVWLLLGGLLCWTVGRRRIL